jgi:hypothetical protein
MHRIDNYTPEQEAARLELLKLIEAEKQEFHRRVDPYFKALCEIENHHMPKYILTSDEKTEFKLINLD